MRSFLKTLFLTSLALALLTFPFSSSVVAQITLPANTSAQPDPNANPVLASVLKLGAKAYYLGARSGLDGWLIFKDAQIQIAYDLPGNQELMIGALFGPSGENISAIQVDSLLDTHPDLKSILMGAAGKPMGAGAVDPSLVANISGAIAQQPTQSPQLVTTPAASALPSAPINAMSKGERLLFELASANGLNVGSPTAPLLMMVMDPTCPHCQKAWKALRDKVSNNSLQIRLIPVTRDPDDAEQVRASAQLLHSQDPFNTWDKYVQGDKSQLAGTPDPALIQAVRSNHALIDRWHIDNTPFLVYRAVGGKVKIIQGEPAQPAALVADIAPQ